MVSLIGPKALTAGVSGATRTFAAQSIGWQGESLWIGDALAIGTTNLTLNDVWSVCKIPAKGRLMGWFLDVTRLDNGGATLVLSVGTLASPGAIGTGYTVGQTAGGGVVGTWTAGQVEGVLGTVFSNTADTIMVVKVTTAAGTPAAGTATCWFNYIADPTQTSP